MNKELLQAALSYRDNGLSVIPYRLIKKPYFKWKKYQKQLPTKEEIYEWFNAYDVQCIAIITGKLSDIVVIDTEAEADISGMDFGETVIAQSGGGGRHFYYKYPLHNTLKTLSKVLPSIDIRSDGGCIIVSPSPHLSGKRYEWITPLDRNNLLDIPEWFIRHVKKEHSNMFADGKLSDSRKKWFKANDALNSIRVERVIAQYTDVGNPQKAIKCPLHNDNNASLHIYSHTNSWNCFGCDRGGMAVHFVMAAENIDYKTARKKLLNQ